MSLTLTTTLTICIYRILHRINLMFLVQNILDPASVVHNSTKHSRVPNHTTWSTTPWTDAKKFPLLLPLVVGTWVGPLNPSAMNKKIIYTYGGRVLCSTNNMLDKTFNIPKRCIMTYWAYSSSSIFHLSSTDHVISVKILIPIIRVVIQFLTDTLVKYFQMYFIQVTGSRTISPA